MRVDSSLPRWRNQVVIWLLLIAILAVVAVSIRTFLDYRRAAIDLLIARDQRVTYLSAARLRDEFSKFSDSLTTLARSEAVYGGEVTRQRRALSQAQPLQEGLFDGGIVLLDNFGRVVAAEPGRGNILGEDWSDREYFRRMLTFSTVYFSDVVSEPRLESDVVVVSVPVVGEGGQFVGVLSGFLRLGQSTISPLYATIVRLRVGHEGGNIYVLDRNGTILFDSGTGNVGERYENAALSDIIMARQPGAFVTENSARATVIASFAPIPGTEWSLVVEDDWRVVTAETQRYLRLLILLLALGLMLLAVGTYLLLRRLYREVPVREYTRNSRQAAEQIKELLIPDVLPVLPGWDLAVYYPAHLAILGDFYDVTPLRDGRLMISMGRINAAGVAAGVILAITRTLLRGACRAGLAPADALARSNDYLCPELPEKSAVSCFYGILDPSRGALEFANAGNEVALYLRPISVELQSAHAQTPQLQSAALEPAPVQPAPFQGVAIRQENAASLAGEERPLGMQLGTKYRAAEITIAPGETLLFYNRELIALRNDQGEAFGTTRLYEVASGAHEDGDHLLEAILSALRTFSGAGEEALERVVVLVLERKNANRMA